MGMDLYSVKSDKYYRFNWTGWSLVCTFLEEQGADLHNFQGDNSGHVVPEDDCSDVADLIDGLDSRLTDLIKCPDKNLMAKMIEAKDKPMTVHLDHLTNIPLFIIERRLKNEKLSVKRLHKEDRDNWDCLSWYAYSIYDFGKYLRACSNLGGFRQC